MQLWIATQVSVIKVKVTVLLLKKEIQFPLNNLSLLWPIDTNFAVWVGYIKRHLGIATQVFLIKVKGTVTKNRNSITIVCFGLLTPNLVHATNATKITASFFRHCHLSFLFLVTSILGWIVENLVSSHCGASCSFFFSFLYFRKRFIQEILNYSFCIVNDFMTFIECLYQF